MDGKEIITELTRGKAMGEGNTTFVNQFSIETPKLWFVESPYHYKAVTRVLQHGSLLYETETGKALLR
jgi:beta-galactosidase/beta-glucuronidase